MNVSTVNSQAHDKRNIIFLFITLMITMLLASLSQNVLSSALPTVVGELHGVELMTWVITAYLLASTVMMPVYGKISDLLGRKPVLIVAIVLFVLGSILGGLAENMDVMIAGRVVQGLGGGGLMILSQAAIADVIPARDRGKYMGYMGAVFAFSSVAGPLLGGWLTEGPGWRWTFWMNVPLGILAIVATLIFMRLPKPELEQRPRIDYWGMMLLATATTTLILLSTWGGSVYEWASAMIITLAIVTVVTAVLFVVVEAKVSEPVMPLYLFRDRNFNLVTIAGLFIALAMFGAVGYMPTYFQMAVGASPAQAGLLMIPMMASILLTSIVTGAMISRTGRYKLIPIIGSVVLAVGVGLLATVTTQTSVVLVVTYLGIMGIGLGTSMQNLILIVQNSFPNNVVGTATAANNFFRQVGGSLGSAVVGAVFTSRLTNLVSQRLPADAGPTDGASSLTPDALKAMPAEIQTIIVGAYTEALIPIFIFVVPLIILSVILLMFVHEKPLETEIIREQIRTQTGPIRVVKGPEDLHTGTVTEPKSAAQSETKPPK